MTHLFNHMKTWTAEHYMELLGHVIAGASVRELSALCGRTPVAIDSKLNMLRLTHHADPYRYVEGYTERAQRLQAYYAKQAGYPATTDTDTTTDTQENTMSKLVTIKHLINGKDMDSMSDSDLYATISTTELEIERLDKIKTKPKRLVRHIEALKSDLQKLVELIDSRDDVAEPVSE